MQSNGVWLKIPQGCEWPVEARNPETGAVILRPGFVEQVEAASGLEMGHLTEEALCELLVLWYVERRRAGEPSDPTMDEILVETIYEDLGEEAPVDEIMAEIFAPENRSC